MTDAERYRIAFLNWTAEQIAAGRTALDLRRAVNEYAEWNGLICINGMCVAGFSHRDSDICATYQDGVLDAIEMMEGKA